MKEITYEDYLEFIKKNDFVIIENVKVKLQKKWNNIKTYAPPKDYSLEHTTVWSFSERGNWATHKGNYRGNWSPYVPRNLILKYTQKGDLVLDQMMGSGTTLVEAKLLGRNAIGVDINLDAVMVAQDRLNFTYNSFFSQEEPIVKTYLGDARNLDKIKDESIDLIATHPPYANIISYTKTKKLEDDLSCLPLEEYFKEMRKVAEEAFRVLKPGKVCAILIGDTRKHRHYIPIAFRVMQIFLDVGFILKEDIIKLQWNMKTTRERWRAKEYEFYLIAHEHVFVFRKPLDEKEYKKYKFSSKFLTL